MKSTFSFVASALLGACLAAPGIAVAQVNPAFSDVSAAVDEARTILQAERKEIIRQGMQMTPAEEAKFWPVYDKYAVKLKEVGDRRVKLITDYAASAWRMNDETANDLLKQGMKYNDELQDLREDYINNFKNVLPTVKVARFYQLETKLDAITNFALAREIPLMPPAEPPVKKP